MDSYVQNDRYERSEDPTEPGVIALEGSEDPTEPGVIALGDFLRDFGSDLLAKVQVQNPPTFSGQGQKNRDAILDRLLRKPFDRQREAIHALCSLLVDQNEKAGILNGEMGTGKTMMAIGLTAILQQAEGFNRTLVIAPPHLVYKWRREILETVPNARVWVLNGPESLVKLLCVREWLNAGKQADIPEYFILGRVRMRMGFHWRLAYALRQMKWCETNGGQRQLLVNEVVACPRCATPVTDPEGSPYERARFESECQQRRSCKHCGEALWTLMQPKRQGDGDKDNRLRKLLCKLPSIGPKTAQKLIDAFGSGILEDMLADNIYEFINLVDSAGELVFADRQAARMERAMATMEFDMGKGDYQPTEFIKRYLPNQFFDLLVVDEGHEYKNAGSAQGQAMGVLCNKVRKVLLLTGTLMGGYASDLFYLLFRIMPRRMIDDDFGYSQSGSLGSASMAFMREFGVLIDTFRETEGASHITARGSRTTVRTKKGPGFSPQGILRYILPYTVFVRLSELDNGVLPPYEEHFESVPMSEEQMSCYARLASNLTSAMKQALAQGDTSLIGVVINVLLAWPDCCFREEIVKHPRTRSLLASVPAILSDQDVSNKERRLIDLCLDEQAQGRRCLVYTVYTGKRDTGTRLRNLMQAYGLKVAVLRSTVATGKREDWIAEQVERDIDVLICNPELVKTGLDLLDFPTIAFMQTGYNVYTLQQAARRSWRIGQHEAVHVYFFGYQDTAQIDCLELMASKISVSQSTSGDMPESGLDVLNSSGDSVEVALAKQLVSA